MSIIEYYFHTSFDFTQSGSLTAPATAVQYFESDTSDFVTDRPISALVLSI